MPAPSDPPPMHASRLLSEAVARAGLTEDQVELLKDTASSAMLPADLFSSTPVEQIAARLEEAERVIESLLAAGGTPGPSEFRVRTRWQQQLAICARREDLLASRQCRWPGCWCFGQGGRDEIGLVAFHPDHTYTAWDGSVRRLPLSAPQVLTEAGISEQTYREICPNCPEGRAVLEDRTRGERLILQDYQRRSLTRRWRRTGIPEGMRELGLDVYPEQDKIARIERWYRGEVVPGQREYRAGLVLHGENQRGKSTIGYLLAARAFDAGQGVLCRTLPNLFGELTATLDADTRQNSDPDQPKAVSHEGLLEDLKTVWLLMLDDLGTEKQSEYTERTLFQILEARKQAGPGLRTIITSNLRLAEIADRFGPRNWGRLSGMFGRLVIDWPMMGPAAEGMLDLDELVEIA